MPKLALSTRSPGALHLWRLQMITTAPTPAMAAIARVDEEILKTQVIAECTTPDGWIPENVRCRA